ncbi:MAG: outer membrane lipoprotein-sorting protein [Deltaproteobacteria bacterium]|nr:outer membrane lipoprotein-sorting protein [Deltaproteobacteria bacterium]
MKSIKLIKGRYQIARVAAIIGVSLIAPSIAHGTEDPSKLIADADQARGGLLDGVSWQVAVHSVIDDKTEDLILDFKRKGYNARLDIIEPAARGGEALLFRDRDLYYKKPGLKRPMIINPSQKTLGPTSNGDLAAADYARDYNASITGSETLSGTDCYVLMLTAKQGRKPTYQSVRYWISKDKHLGLKAEFLTASGEVFKTATYTYDAKIKMGNKTVPFISAMSFQDKQKPKNTTQVKILNPTVIHLNDSEFELKNFSK